MNMSFENAVTKSIDVNGTKFVFREIGSSGLVDKNDVAVVEVVGYDFPHVIEISHVRFLPFVFPFRTDLKQLEALLLPGGGDWVPVTVQATS